MVSTMRTGPRESLLLRVGKIADRHPLGKIIKIGTPAAAAGITAAIDIWASYGSIGISMLMSTLFAAGLTAGTGKIISVIAKLEEKSDKLVAAEEAWRSAEQKLAEAENFMAEVAAGRIDRSEREKWQICELPIRLKGVDSKQTYILSEQFGGGGQGAVRLAINLSQNNRPEVFKIAYNQCAQDREYFGRFMAEIETLEKLKHPGVMEIYGHGEFGGAPFYSMPYINGISLTELIHKVGRLPMLRATELMAEIADIFRYVHGQGIAHRDAKPDNIVISRKGEIILLDFGLARDTQIARHLTQTGLIFGTPEYMSYEQHMGRKADHRTDIFSEGEIFYEMLTGTPPYPITPNESYAAYIKRTLPQLERGKFPPIVSRIPNVDMNKVGDAMSFLQDMFRKLLAADPEKRYQSNEGFIADLAQLKKMLQGTDATFHGVR